MSDKTVYIYTLEAYLFDCESHGWVHDALESKLEKELEGAVFPKWNLYERYEMYEPWLAEQEAANGAG